MKVGAFDEAVINVDAIIHTASPVGLFGGDPSGKIYTLNSLEYS